jgi:methyl-accepting chemotaxis protein
LELASVASISLSELTLAIQEQGRVAQALAARAEAMRNVSGTVTTNVASVSAVVDQNAVAASEMSKTAELIADAIATVANETAAQSAAAEELSATCVELTGQMRHIEDTASRLSAESTTLTELMGGFRLGTDIGHKPARAPSPRVGAGAHAG